VRDRRTGPYDPEAAARMASDPDVARSARAFFETTYRHRYSYNFSWLGRPIIQYPQDIVALQEIVWRTQPRTIVETGIAHGGSTVFFASMLALLGGDRRVIAVDVDIRPHNRSAIETHPMARFIELIEGSSVDPAVIGAVAALARGRGPAMVVLDSHHSHAHVRAELAAYSPLVMRGSYLVVMDTIVERLPKGTFPPERWDVGDNPMTAVDEFLSATDRFEIDESIERKLLITAAPRGYLRCVKD
jgi:cephalosporin hydroxylase